MTADQQTTEMIAPDPSLEGSGALFADMAGQSLLDIMALNGWAVETVKPVQLLYRPGRYAMVRNAVWARRGDSSRRFSVTTELARKPRGGSAPAPATDQVPVAMLQESEFRRSWVLPFDPVLSGLAEVLSVEGARRIAEPVFGRPCSVRSTIVRYRPTKRAVVRFEVRPRGRSHGPPMILYVKVLRVDAADTIMRLLPVMATVGDSYVLPTYRPAADILVYPAREGISMREALTGRDSAAIPHPDAILDVLDNLGTLDDPGTPGPSSAVARLDRSMDLLRAALPHHAPALAEIAEEIRAALGRDGIPPVVVHGDFYEGQLLIDEAGALAGVLDVDDIGMGDPVMDAANYTAHLVALGESHPEVSSRLDAHRRVFRMAYLERSGVDERALGAREAVAGLGLATGPFRVLSPGWPARMERRIALAARSMRVSVG